MTIIVAGKLTLKSGSRDELIDKSRESIILARESKSCLEFSVSPDPIEPNRVNIFGKWRSRIELEQFHDTGPDNDLLSLVEVFDVNEYEVNT